MVEIKQQCNGQIVTEPEIALPLVTVPASEFSKENGAIWASSPDRLELLQKPFHQSNSSDSPCVSESGSDIFSKREVIQKLRRQLKRRDDMILEMQDQITELQNSLGAQLSHSSHLQSLLDAANRDIFDSEREIQRLRKAIADHCVGHVDSSDNPPMVPAWPTGGRNGHSNGYLKVESNVESSENGGGDEGKIEMLRREVSELKEVVEGKEYLLQSYKGQKAELSEKIKELQQRLDSQLPHIL
ncbi:Intracellular transport USO1 isoform 5 [Olea europaea subsp. europaea]|nr:Intracellular transport USO1 isoform 5 [Olea europaea subsp. europaea]